MTSDEDDDEEEDKVADKRDFSRLGNGNGNNNHPHSNDESTKYTSGTVVRVIRVFEAYKPKRS